MPGAKGCTEAVQNDFFSIDVETPWLQPAKPADVFMPPKLLVRLGWLKYDTHYTSYIYTTLHQLKITY